MTSRDSEAESLFFKSIDLVKLGALEEAKGLLLRARELCPSRPSVLNNLAGVERALGNFEAARSYASEALFIDPNSAEAHFNLSLACRELGDRRGLIAALEGFYRFCPADVRGLKLLAEYWDGLGDLTRARSYLARAREFAPSDLQVLINLGAVCNDLGDYQTALSANQQAVLIKPTDSHLNSSLALSLSGLDRHDEALALHGRLLRGGIADTDLDLFVNYGVSLIKAGRYECALDQFDLVLKKRPCDPSLLCNKGAALAGVRDFDGALRCYQHALQIQPDFRIAHANIAGVLASQGKTRDAIDHYCVATAEDQSDLASLINLGDCYLEVKDPEKALVAYDRAVRIEEHRAYGSDNYAVGSRQHARMFSHDWSDYQRQCETIKNRALDGLMCAQPFTVLSLFDDPRAHRALAETIIRRRHWHQSNDGCASLLARRPINSHPIRIGYFSADFKDHAVARLIIGLLEHHSREKFELHAFAFNRIPDDAISARLRKCFDFVHEVAFMADRAISKLANDHNIDVAVDLSGFTAGCRPSVFAHRAAPIQINFLGYPGTMGSPFHDYLILDGYICKDEHRPFYSECVIRLPCPYQPNDPLRDIASGHPEPSDLGFDVNAKKFIFCCFNNVYKITPEIFECWMKILRSCDDSMLWLLADSNASSEALKQHAKALGIDPARLVFAPKLPLDRHLRRLKMADVFLDTFPYNAHTTASDALWCGVPIVTMSGNSFASRVAGSFLHHIGVNHGIALSLSEYERNAIEYYTNSRLLSDVKLRLGVENQSLPLFDIQKFTQFYEEALLQAVERHRRGLPPKDIDIEGSVKIKI